MASQFWLKDDLAGLLAGLEHAVTTAHPERDDYMRGVCDALAAVKMALGLPASAAVGDDIRAQVNRLALGRGR